MGFASFDEQAKNMSVQMDDQSCKDFSFSALASSSDDISSVASSDSSDDEDSSHTSSQADSLNDMSSLLLQLPIKRGLSRHYEGKSQSFTSLSSVRCLEDLAKPEHPYNKKLKSCKSYVGLYGETQISNQKMSSNIIPKNTSSRLVSKKTSRGSCSSFINSAAKRNSNNSNDNNITRPPTHPPSYRASNTQTPLFEVKDSFRCAVPFFTA